MSGANRVSFVFCDVLPILKDFCCQGYISHSFAYHSHLRKINCFLIYKIMENLPLNIANTFLHISPIFLSVGRARPAHRHLGYERMYTLNNIGSLTLSHHLRCCFNA